MPVKPQNQIVVVDGKAIVAKRISRSEAMEKSEMYVVKNLPKYLKKIHQLAMGILAIKDTKDGPMVYSIPPNQSALEYLVDRGLGRIPQRHEITGEGGGAIEVIPWLPASSVEVIDATIIPEVSNNATDVQLEDGSYRSEQGKE